MYARINWIWKKIDLYERESFVNACWHCDRPIANTNGWAWKRERDRKDRKKTVNPHHRSLKLVVVRFYTAIAVVLFIAIMLYSIFVWYCPGWHRATDLMYMYIYSVSSQQKFFFRIECRYCNPWNAIYTIIERQHDQNRCIASDEQKMYMNYWLPIALGHFATVKLLVWSKSILTANSSQSTFIIGWLSDIWS